MALNTPGSMLLYIFPYTWLHKAVLISRLLLPFYAGFNLHCFTTQNLASPVYTMPDIRLYTLHIHVLVHPEVQCMTLWQNNFDVCLHIPLLTSVSTETGDLYKKPPRLPKCTVKWINSAVLSTSLLRVQL